MKVESKFLTGEVTLVGLQITRAGVVAEGSLQGMFPVRVVLGAGDARALARVLVMPILRRLGRARAET